MTILSTGVATSFIDFTRASNATVTDSDGKVKWAPHNLLLNSESFDSASWTKNSTVTANNAAAPNSTTTAELVDEGTASGYKQIQQNVTTLAGVNYTLSVFAKYVSCRWLNLSLFDNGSSTQYGAASFDLLNGVVGTSGVAGTGYAIVGSPTMTPLSGSGGWYLCSVTVTNGTSVANRFAFSPSDVSTIGSSGLNTYTGTSKTFQAWGASLYRSDLAMQPNTSAYPMYNPTTAKNLLGFTESFDNAAWAPTNLSVLANTATAPNGLTTADKIYPTANDGSMAVTATSTIALKTFSIYAKAAEFGVLCFREPGNAVNGLAYVNLSTGAVTNSIPATATVTATSAGDGWWRVGVIYASGAAGSVVRFGPSNAVGAISSTASGTNGILVWGAQLSDSASLDPYAPNHFTAPSAAAYYGPRRDFDPVTLACKGLLVEEQRANLLLRSAELSNGTAWPPAAGATVAANTVTAPDGTLSGDTITFNTTNGNRLEQSSGTAVNGETLTFSVWLKGSGIIRINVSTDTGIGGSTETPITLTSSWVRYSATVTFSSPTGNRRAMIIWRTGDTATNVDAWGAQLEAGSFATSYIPTGAATATRNADVASVSTQAFPYSQPEGSLVVNFTPTNTIANSTRVVELSNGAGARVIDLSSNGTGWVFYNGTTQFTAGTATLGATTKIATAYKTGAYAMSVNGGAVSADASSLVNTAASIFIGMNSAAAQLNGHVRQITYLPRRLTNAELVTRSA